MSADRSPHDEADDRLTRACAADGHPPADPDDPTERCACGEKWALPHLTGDCETDCQTECAYPGQFSECSIGALAAEMHPPREAIPTASPLTEADVHAHIARLKANPRPFREDTP